MNRRHTLPLAFTTLTLVASCSPHSDLSSDAITIDSLLTVAEAYIGDTMTVKGFVKSIYAKGDRDRQTVVISDSCGVNRLRIDVGKSGGAMSMGEGDAITVRGVIGEIRTRMTDLQRKETEADSLYKAGGLGEVDYESIKNDIAAKKAFIEFQRRDYYSEFHMDATEICKE